MTITISDPTHEGTRARALLRPEEFAGVCNIGRTKVYAELRAGRVRSVKVGRRRLIPADEVAHYVDLLRRESSP